MTADLASDILRWSLVLAKIALAAAVAMATWRLMVGPRAQDRVLGLDALYVNAMLLLVTFGIDSGTTIYFEMALVIGALGFVGTVAFAKFLMRGEVIE